MNPIRMKYQIKKLYPDWSNDRVEDMVNQIVRDHYSRMDKIVGIKKCERGGLQVDAIDCKMDVEVLFKEIAKNIIDRDAFTVASHGGDIQKAAKESRIVLMRLLRQAVIELKEEF